MRAVVTGAAGFIGSHLTDYLLEQGHEVVAIDALLNGRGDRRRVNPQATFRHCDIRVLLAQDLLKGADWVFHTAAMSTTPWAVADPVTCNDINVTGTLNLLEGAVGHEVSRFVFSSSNVVYGAPTPYKVSKLAAEGYCEAYAHLYGLSTIALRYANVFGSLRQNPENVIMSMRQSWLADGKVWVTGDGGQSRDFVNVADVCRANLLAAQCLIGGTLDICTGENHAMGEVAAMFGCPVEHRPDRLGDVRHITQDPGPAWQALGFAAQVPFAEGMALYLSRTTGLAG